MINLPRDYNTARAYDGNSVPKLTPGGHICRIRTVELTKTRKTNSDMLIVNFDINEDGEFNGHYGRIFDSRRKYNMNAAWPGVFRTTIATADGHTNGFFKGLIDAVEASNPGYSFTATHGNEQTLQGKLVGFNFGEEEYEVTNQSTGEIRQGVTVKPQYAVSVAKVREGVIPPAIKRLSTGSAGQPSSAPQTAQQPQPQEDDYDDELPF